MKKLIVGIAICLFGFICVNTVFAEPYYMSMNMCIELDEDDTFTLYEDGEKIGVYEYACGEYDEEGDKITYMELYEDEDPGVVIMRYKSLTGNGVPNGYMVYHDAQDTLLVSHLGSGEEYFFPHRPFRLVDSPDPFLSISSLRDVSGYYFDKDHTMLTINMDNNGRLRYIKKKLELIEGAVKQVEKRANDPEDAIRIKVTEPTNISEYLVQKRRDGSIKFCSANDDSMNLNFFEADIFDIAGCMKLHNMYKSTPGMAERVIQRKKALAKEKRDIAEFNKNLFTESDIANLPLLKLTGNYSGGFGLVKWVFHDGHLAIQYPLCPLFEYTVFVKNGVWYLDPLNTQTKRAIDLSTNLAKRD